MGLKDTLQSIHRVLDEAGVGHALIGGLALATLGIHRATFDVDLLIDGSDQAAAKRAVCGAGWRLAMETAEVLHFEGNGRVDFLLANRKLAREMLNNARPTGIGIRVVAAEALIGLKIQAFKNDPDRELQDKADIKAIINKTDNLDWSEIRAYADLFDEWPFVESLKRKR